LYLSLFSIYLNTFTLYKLLDTQGRDEEPIYTSRTVGILLAMSAATGNKSLSPACEKALCYLQYAE